MEVEGQEEYWYWYMLGHEDGYESAKWFEQGVNDKELRHENAILKGELATLSKTKEDLKEEAAFIKNLYEKYSDIS